MPFHLLAYGSSIVSTAGDWVGIKPAGSHQYSAEKTPLSGTLFSARYSPNSDGPKIRTGIVYLFLLELCAANVGKMVGWQFEPGKLVMVLGGDIPQLPPSPPVHSQGMRFLYPSQSVRLRSQFFEQIKSNGCWEAAHKPRSLNSQQAQQYISTRESVEDVGWHR
ncbi:hypothetical protein EMCG_01769 [[Emmonsia] crescens]|uniref:Uncharacterized protein n=1 Tax=[Emmonsia] crescens TaxID=73230 RepID=A0A0G2J9F9_9EURO|nr:hypothetical protein EMCG_01769 [Emmonsia crescens UAMH 3008]